MEPRSVLKRALVGLGRGWLLCVSSDLTSGAAAAAISYQAVLVRLGRDLHQLDRTAFVLD